MTDQKMFCASDDCFKPTAGKSKYCKEHRAEARERFKAMCAEKSAERESRYEGFRITVEKAHQAGKQAAETCTPRTMIVGKPGEYAPVTEGPCGFASIHFKGNTSFGKWAAKNIGARRDSYKGGLYLWVSDYGQSYDRKTAYADAYAQVLRANGIADAYSDGRLD